ncbi:MAG: hypothetical protein IPP71_08190 [Bacteroidetes bacterium]|nr:hypothetical protein [Bacteroidota bacterium]
MRIFFKSFPASLWLSAHELNNDYVCHTPMKTHLIRSPEVSAELFSNVVAILQQFEGPVEFVIDPFDIPFENTEIDELPFDYTKFKQRDQFILGKVVASNKNLNAIEWRPPFPDEIKKVTWKSIFDKCDLNRKKNHIPETEAVIILTDYINEKNWFSGSAPNGKLNFFVHAGQWEFFLPCDARFPVAYETIAVVFRHLLFGSFDEINRRAHERPRGCVNDFCKEKKDITFKLRTADLCPDCYLIIEERKVNPAVVSQFFQTIDHIRSQMLFRERFKTTRQPSRIEISGGQQKICFSDLGNAELKLSPLEKTVYLLFLKHPNGLHLNEIHDHTAWLEETYSKLGNVRSLVELKNSIAQLTDPTENSVSEKFHASETKSSDLSVTIWLLIILLKVRGQEKS